MGVNTGGRLDRPDLQTTDASLVPSNQALDAAAAQADAVRAARKQATEHVEAEAAKRAAADAAKIHQLETSLETSKQERAKVATAGLIDGFLASSEGDVSDSGLKLRKELIDLKALHLGGERTEGQNEAWFVKRAHELHAAHRKRVEEAAKDGNLSDLPDVTGGGATNGANLIGGFDGWQYMLDIGGAVKKLGSRFSFDMESNFSAHHEALKDKIAKTPKLKELFDTERNLEGRGENARVIPFPVRHLHAAANFLPEDMEGLRVLSETYGSDAGTRRQPTYRRDWMVPFFRPGYALAFLGVPTLTIDNDQTFPVLTGSHSATWEAENATVADSSLTVAVATTSPKRLACRNDVSWELLAAADSQFGHVALIMSEFGRAVMQAAENAVYMGSGSSNQPRGLNGTTAIATQTTAASNNVPTYKEIQEAVASVANRNIPTDMWRWALNPTTQVELSSILRFGSTEAGNWNSPAWRENDAPIGDVGSWMAANTGRLVGRPAAVTTQLPNNLTINSVTGNSPMFGGDWMYVFDIAYSMAYITIDDVSQAAAGQTRMTVNAYRDVHVRLANAFAKFAGVF